MNEKCILLLSGGIDSTTLLCELTAKYSVTCLIFDYEQTLSKEVDFAINNCIKYNSQYILVKIPLAFIGGNCSILGKSIITQGRTIKQISEGDTPSSYVPFRNGIFLSYAISYGEANNITDIYCGGNGLNSGKYWDDTLEFADKMQQAASCGTSETYFPKIHFPYSTISKKDIVKRGLNSNVNYSNTWSCYKNDQEHCDLCDSCVQRNEALS